MRFLHRLVVAAVLTATAATAIPARIVGADSPTVPNAAAPAYRLFFAEGAGGMFRTRYALANPDEAHATSVTLHFLNDDGSEVVRELVVPALGRVTIEAGEIDGLSAAFGLEVRADSRIAAERVMDWGDGRLGSHAERGIAGPATTWYFAEGATLGSFEVFYLLLNPGTTPAQVEATYLLPAPAAPVTRTYTVPPRSRFTVWASQEGAELVDAEFSAVFTASAPIIAERSQYTVHDGQLLGGHSARGIVQLASEWFFAEGATGGYFNTYILLANPASEAAELEVTYLLPDGQAIALAKRLAPRSRTTLWLNHEDPALVDTAVTSRVRVLNGVSIAAERAMWWPVAQGSWLEGHASPGSTVSATQWAVPSGGADLARAEETFVLISNATADVATVDVAIGFEDGGAPSAQTFTVAPTSRLNIWVNHEFPDVGDRRYAVFLTSRGSDDGSHPPTPVVVESSVYASGEQTWSAGRNAMASPGRHSLPDLSLTVLGHDTPEVVLDLSLNAPVPRLEVESDDAALVTASLDDPGGLVRVRAGGLLSGGTHLTIRLIEDDTVVESRRYPVLTSGPIRFADLRALPLGYWSPEFVHAPDGTFIPFGTVKGDNGDLEVIDFTAAGLASLMASSQAGWLKDVRVSDVNGDRIPDVVAVSYAPIEADQPARLYLGQADGTFVEAEAFRAMNLRGWSETIVIADFDNDGDLDIFIPTYTHDSPEEQNFLLRNDGTGRFEEVADEAGVAMRGWPNDVRVEGAQAVDFNGDGWLDFYVGSHLFLNKGDMTFENAAPVLGLFADTGAPVYFDEGAKFTDWNNDGYLDLVVHHPLRGPRLFEFDGARFHWRQVFVPQDPADLYDGSFGLNIADLNGDGLEDLIVPGGNSGGQTMVFLNTGNRFVREVTALDVWQGDALAFGDIDGDGRFDVYNRNAIRPAGQAGYAMNASPMLAHRHLRVEVVGDSGERNQAGRVVRVSPGSAPDTIYTRVVDGGSGYLSRNQYELLIPLPFDESHVVRVSFDHGDVTFDAKPGERVRVFRTGQIERW